MGSRCSMNSYYFYTTLSHKISCVQRMNDSCKRRKICPKASFKTISIDYDEIESTEHFPTMNGKLRYYALNGRWMQIKHGINICVCAEHLCNCIDGTWQELLLSLIEIVWSFPLNLLFIDLFNNDGYFLSNSDSSRKKEFPLFRQSNHIDVNKIK